MKTHPGEVHFQNQMILSCVAPLPRKSPVDCLRDRLVIMGYDFVIEVLRRIDTEAGFKALLRR